MASFVLSAARFVAITSIAILPFSLSSQQPAHAYAAPGADRVTGWRSDITFWLDQIQKQHYVYKS